MSRDDFDTELLRAKLDHALIKNEFADLLLLRAQCRIALLSCEVRPTSF